MEIAVLYSDPYGERFVGNLVNFYGFCTACEPYEQKLYCDFCRYLYGSYAENIEAVYKVEKPTAVMVDEPERLLPEIPNCDLVVAIALHPDLMLSLPEVLASKGVKALITPVEDPAWLSPGLRRQLERICMELGLEYAAPKPFCSLDVGSHEVINGFIRLFKVGKPVFDIEVSQGVVKSVAVLRSSPCGSSWYVARKIALRRVEELPDVVSKAHHAYPCTASMSRDPELGDTILHEAGYILFEAVYRGISDPKAAELFLEKIRERGAPL